jgi:hypothetical protein
MMETWTDFPFSIQIDDILRGQGMDPNSPRARRPAFLQIAEVALGLGFPLLHPSASVCEALVREVRHERLLLENDATLTGPLVSRYLAGAERIAAVVCTIGPGLEKLASEQEDVLLGLAMDGLGNAAIEAVGQQVCARLAQHAQAQGLETSAPLGPGEPDWSVGVGQPQLFGLFDPAPPGVRLAESGMMHPRKSVSFVVGIGQHMEQVDLCELCSLKERCHYRHA